MSETIELNGTEDIEENEKGSDVEKVFGKLYRKNPEKVTEIMAMMGVGSMGNPLHNKMNEEHITQVLDLATKHDEREYNVHMSNQDKGDKQTFPLNSFA